MANFQDVYNNVHEKFDYITLIGVFEYAGLYINSNEPYSKFLNMIASLLKPDGKIIIAIENRLGLKYFAGCKEDHVGKYYTGIEDAYSDEGVRTFSKRELIKLFNENGFSQYEFYYPYPDYKLPEAIYSDENLPHEGELINNMRNFDAERYVVFDESKAFDGIIKASLFDEFSNSYIIELSNKAE